jgi:MYXO-CTERM domain-containing protein
MAQLQTQFVIPEPGALTLAAGVGLIALARRRHRR